MISEELRKNGAHFAQWFMTAGKDLKQQVSSDLGLKPIVVSAEDGRTELQFELDSRHCNFMGILHGGIIATLLDDTVGASACALVGRGFRGTISTAISYFAAARPGTMYTIGEVKKTTSSLIFVEAKLLSSERELIAASTSVVTYGPLRSY